MEGVALHLPLGLCSALLEGFVPWLIVSQRLVHGAIALHVGHVLRATKSVKITHDSLRIRAR